MDSKQEPRQFSSLSGRLLRCHCVQNEHCHVDAIIFAYHEQHPGRRRTQSSNAALTMAEILFVQIQAMPPGREARPPRGRTTDLGLFKQLEDHNVPCPCGTFTRARESTSNNSTATMETEFAQTHHVQTEMKNVFGINTASLEEEAKLQRQPARRCHWTCGTWKNTAAAGK